MRTRYPTLAMRWLMVSWCAVVFLGCTPESMPTSNDPDAGVPTGPGIEQEPVALVFFPPCPEHGVTRGFHIGKYEVTNAEYKEFVDATGYDGSDHPSSKEPFLGHFRNGTYPPEQGDFPVCHLNWYHAKAFCQWLSKRLGKPFRLPTKLEWECVAGGAEGRVYPWGNEWDPKRCNWSSSIDGYSGAAPVGSFPGGATPEGVHDLAGNIWEWCEDKALRGGTWCLGKESMTTSFSSFERVDRADDKFGFRIVLAEER